MNTKEFYLKFQWFAMNILHKWTLKVDGFFSLEDHHT